MTLGNQSNEIGYRIFRADGTGGGLTFNQIGTALANAVSYTDNTTVGGQDYTYYVQSYSAGGDTNSNEVPVLAP